MTVRHHNGVSPVIQANKAKTYLTFDLLKGKQNFQQGRKEKEKEAF